MRTFFMLFIVVFLLGGMTGLAMAQVVSPPEQMDAPWAADVSGFLSFALGLVYLPVFEADASSTQTNFAYGASDEQVGIPGFSAHMSLIPAWGNNGVMIEGGYELVSFGWKQQARSATDEYRGESTLELSMMSLSTNYVRYFLSGADRIYLLAGAGYMWERATLSTETGDEGSTDEAGFPNWRGNTGIGYLHQMRSGAIGTELRADFPLSQTEIDLNDPYGPYEITLDHPVMIRWCVTFMIGRLLTH